MLQGYRTIIAALAALIAALCKQAGLEVDEDGLTTGLITITGLIGAIYYRYIANRKLHYKGWLE